MVKRNKLLIHKFLSRKLSKREKSRFLKRASTDKEFIKEFVKGIELNEVIEDEYGNDDNLSDNDSTSNKRIRPIIILLTAAVFLLSAFIISPKSKNQNTDRIYKRYYEPLPVSTGIQRGEVENTVENIAVDLQLYLEGEYETSINHFQGLKLASEYQKAVHFYMGLSYIGAEKYSEAIAVLEPLIDDNAIYVAEAKWYLSLCYIKRDRIDDANELLSELEQYSYYKIPTKKLLRKLK